MGGRIGVGEIVLLLLSLGVSAGIVGALEWVVRAQLDVYRCDSRYGWTFRPGSTGLKLNRHLEFFHRVHFNNEGFNDDPWAEPSEDVFRILLLGDSFAASLQVSRREHFASRLEALLNQRVLSGRRIEILNAGVDGYGTAQELLLLRDLASRHEPDLVVLQMYIQNDMSDNFHLAGDWNHYLANRCGRPYFQEVNGEVLLSAPPEPYQPSGWDRLLRHSMLYSSLIAPAARRKDDPASRMSDTYTTRRPASWRDAWELTQRLVLTVRDEARQHGMGFAVMSVPTKQAAGQLSGRFRERGWPLERWQQGHALLGSFLRQADLTYVDLLPSLRCSLLRTGRSPYFEHDHHWNADGHEVVAEAISEALTESCEDLGLPVQGCEPSVDGHRPDPRRSQVTPPRLPVRGAPLAEPAPPPLADPQ